MNNNFDIVFCGPIVVIGGQGAVKARAAFVRSKEERKMPRFGPKNETDPKIRYDARERYAHYLKKEFKGCPSAFLYKFEKQIVRHKASFYVNIYNDLINDFNSKLVKDKKFVNYYQNHHKINYNVLHVDRCKISVAAEEMEEEPLSFWQPDLVTKRRSINNRLISKLIKLCKAARDPVKKRPRDAVLLLKLKMLILNLRNNRLPIHFKIDVSEWLRRALKHCKPEMPSINPLEPEVEIQTPPDKISKPEGLLDKVFTKAGDKVGEHVHDSVKEVSEDLKKEVRNILNDVRDDLKKGYSAISEDVSTDGQKMFSDIISQLVHAIMNPNLKTIAWCVLSLFVQLGLTAFNRISAYMSVLQDLLNKWFNENLSSHSTEQNTSAKAKPEGNVVCDDEAISWVATLWGIISSTIGITVSKPRNLSDFVSVLRKDLEQGARSSNHIFVFVRNNFAVLKKMMHYIFSIGDKDYKMAQLFEHSEECVKMWVQEVLSLTNPDFKNENQHLDAFVDRVEQAHMFGNVMLTNMSEELKQEKNTAIILKMLDKVSKLRDELIAGGKYCNIRKMPFTIFIYGEKGIGKSSLINTMSVDLLKSIDYKLKGELTCVISPMQKFWNQCKHQPVLVVDDLWAVESGEALERQLSTIFEVHSPVPLTPPMAHLDDKKMRYNPEIFFNCSNKPWPNFPNVDMGAVYRRRDVMLHARRTTKKIREECKLEDVPGCEHCKDDNVSLKNVTASFLKDLHHIQFRLVLNPEIPDTSDKNHDVWKTYEGIMEDMKLAFYRNRENVLHMFETSIRELEEIREPLMSSDETIYDTFHNMNRANVDEYMKQFNNSTLTSDLRAFWKNVSSKSGLWVKCKQFQENCINPLGSIFERSKPEANINEVNEAMNDEEVMFDWSDEQTRLLDQCVHEGFINQKMRDVFERVYVRCDMSENINNNTAFNILAELFSVWQVRRFSLGLSYSKSWTSFYKIFKKYACGHIECRHFKVIDKSLHYNSVGLFTGTQKLNVEKCTQNCFMESALFKHLFYEHWLKTHTLYMTYYKKQQFKYLPEYFASILDEVKIEVSWCKILATRCYDIFMKYVNAPVRMLFKFLRTYWPVILAVMYTGALSYASYAMNRCEINNPYSPYHEYRAWGAPENVTSYNNMPRAPHARVVPEPHSGPQSAIPQYEAAIQRIKTNTVIITVWGDKGDQRHKFSFRCIILRSREMLFLRHYKEQCREFNNLAFRFKFALDSEKRLGNPDGIPFDLFSCKCSYFGEELDGRFSSSLGVMQLPVNIPECRNLIKFIAPQRVHRYASSVGALIQPENNSIYNLNIDFMGSKPHYIDTIGGSSEIYMTQVYAYEPHAPGFCGSILVVNNSETPIIGIHVAGMDATRSQPGYGISEPLMAETFAVLPHPEHTPYEDYCGISLEPADLAKIPLETMLYPLGTVDMRYAGHQSGKTQWVPSAVSGTFEVKTAPAPLSSRDERVLGHDPMKLGCEKHGLPPLNFNHDMIREAGDDLYEDLIQKCKPIRNNIGLLTLEESVVGCKEMEELDALDMSTSEGFPLVAVRPKNVKGKSWLFDLTETKDGFKLHHIHPYLKRQLELTDALRKKGIKPMTIFTDCLKDETLPIEKTLIPGKTRIFSISPIQYTIIFRQYYGDFMCAYRRNRLSLEHAIGINVESLEWTKLLGLMQSKGQACIAGDYSNFGPALMEEVALEAFRCIIRWYTYYAKDSKEEYRWILAQEMLGALHLCVNLVYQVGCGVPSGSPITDIMNSMVNCLYIRIAWKSIMQLPFQDYYLNVKLLTYGDDLLMNVSDKVKEEFNTETLSKFFKQYAIKFTDEAKTGEIVKYKSVLDCTFLKRGFKNHPHKRGIWLAPLNKVSVEGASNWINSKHDLVEATKVNVECSVRLAFGHGPAYFNQVRSKLMLACARKNICIKLPTWNDLDDQFFNISKAKPESDIQVHGENDQSPDTASNVVILDSKEQTREITCPPVCWSEYTSTDIKPKYNEIVDRWLLVHTLKWSKDDEVGKSLWNSGIQGVPLPKTVLQDGVVVKNLCNMPNLMPFRVHQYIKTDMTVKVVVNSNRFQIGQLQVAWYYEADEDQHSDTRWNVYSTSMLHHVLVSASASNEAVLEIKYKNHNPMVNIWKDGKPDCNMGRLYIRVLNPLTVGANGTGECNLSVYIKFSNSVFSGMINHDVITVKPEMEYVTMMGAMKLLDKYLPDENRDNPPSVIPPIYVTPTASHSWSVGNASAEPLHPMRLDSRGQTRFPSLCPIDEKLTVKDICSKFCLIDQVTWTKDNHAGSRLWSAAGSPFLEREELKISGQNVSTADAYYMPPLMFLASMFKDWRGTLELRADVIASPFHTGSIMVSYIPGIRLGVDDKVTVEMAKGSPHVVWSLQENNQFTFSIPYIADRIYWPRRYAGNFESEQIQAPSRVYIHVINPLIPMQSVSDKVYLNLYIRAGPDFEVIVPVQPCIGSALHLNYNTELDDLITLYKYPYMYGTWDRFYEAKWLVMRHSEDTDDVAEADMLKFESGVKFPHKGTGYYVELVNREAGVTIEHKTDGRRLFIRYAVPFAFDINISGSTWHGIGFIPTYDLRDTEALATWYSYYEGKLQAGHLNAYAFPSKEWKNSSISHAGIKPIFVLKSIVFSPDKPPHFDNQPNIVDTFELVAQPEGERDSTSNIVNPTGFLRSTGSGLHMFGESFGNLKDLMRRYQFYGRIVVTIRKGVDQNSCLFTFPCLPQGLDLNVGDELKTFELGNRCREGIIPLILSMYRYFRGSLRFRIVPNVDDVRNVWIQHRPDRHVYSRKITPCGSVETAQGIMNHGYAFYIQNLRVNNIIEFEVPFYQVGAYGLLQTVSPSNSHVYRYESLGEIAVGVESYSNTEDVERAFTVYYSLADDFSVSEFVGPYPAFLLDDLPGKTV